MDLYVKFLFEFFSIFFNGIMSIINGIIDGVVTIFNVPKYIEIVNQYKEQISGGGWIIVILAIIFILVMFIVVGILIFFFIKKYIRFRKTLVEQESMLEEVAELNKKVSDLVSEKQKILAMKVSQLGLKPGDEEEVKEEEKEEIVTSDNVRFSKLNSIDIEFKDYKLQNYNNSFDLKELIDLFRNFAASKLRLYYTEDMIRLFIASLASTKLVILQGISGTGKTSLAYAWGKFIKNDAIIASVQPSWRDRTELFGYFNEFTKKFNETEVLKKMYEAGYNDDVYVTVLDEMNISRVEYYFAEMLSILEMPSRDEWLIELVPSVWDTDPKKLLGGKLRIPGNMWYIGTINNDDSTFAVTDKVYDRAMPIDINDKGKIFEPVPTDALNINSSYLENLFDEAVKNNPISDKMKDQIEKMDDYVIQHFRIAFGNRIVKQMNLFVPVYVECGGKEVDGVDYFIARKILRKFEQLNLSYIRDEIDGFIKYLDNEFGKENFKECKEYLLRLKKMA